MREPVLSTRRTHQHHWNQAVLGTPCLFLPGPLEEVKTEEKREAKDQVEEEAPQRKLTTEVPVDTPPGIKVKEEEETSAGIGIVTTTDPNPEETGLEEETSHGVPATTEEETSAKTEDPATASDPAHQTEEGEEIPTGGMKILGEILDLMHKC